MKPKRLFRPLIQVIDRKWDDASDYIEEISRKIKRFGSIEIGEGGFGETSDYHPHAST